MVELISPPMIKPRKPKPVTLETRRDAESHQWLQAIAAQVLKGINQKLFFPRTGFWCKDCKYAEHCQTWHNN